MKPPSVPMTVQVGPADWWGRRFGIQGDAVGGRIRHKKLQVEESGVAGVEYTEPVSFRFNGDFGIDRAVDKHCIAEKFGNDGRIDSQGIRFSEISLHLKSVLS